MPAKILLVDDDIQLRDELRLYLEEYEMVEAESGEEAIALLKRPNEIDLVILDLMLPGTSGIDILRKIKELDPCLSVIIFTAHSSKDAAVEALKGHADDYIEKSNDVTRLKQSIERIILEKCGTSPKSKDAEHSKMDRAKLFLERNCYKKTSLEDVAMSVSLSPKYLSRIFKERCGINFIDYRHQIKMREAKRLLRSFNLNINQVAGKLGYMNAESFIRMFKKTSGMSPSQYRDSRPHRAHVKVFKKRGNGATLPKVKKVNKM